MSRRKKGQPTFKNFQNESLSTFVNTDTKFDLLREEQIESVKNYSSSSEVNPYQSLPVTGLSRTISKKLPDNTIKLVQYYNYIDSIHATSFVEKCRILAHASSMFHNKSTKDEFKESEGSWKEFLAKIGLSKSQANRYVSFWNLFGEKILAKAVENELSSSKLAELLTWPEDIREVILKEKKYLINHELKSVFEMTREEIRAVKRQLNSLIEEKKEAINSISDSSEVEVNIKFNTSNDLVYQKLKKYASEKNMGTQEIIRLALLNFLENTN